MSDRYGPSSTRRSPRKKSRYESSLDDGHSAVYSDKDVGSDSGVSYLPGSTTSSRRRSSSRSHHHSHHDHHSRPSHRSQSHRHHQRSHRHSHHRRQKLLGPAEDGEKPRDGPGAALAVREDYQVQTVPRAHHAGGSDDDEGEEVYDHRPKPLSHRSHSHTGVSKRRGGARGQQASDADKGFFMAAAALAVSLIICCGDVDND